MVRESEKNKFQWQKLAKPFFSLAPMAGYTDQPFRLICKSFGADVLFSEMISSEAIYHKLKLKNSKLKIDERLFKTLKLIQFSEAERPFIVQIFGSDPKKMAFAAEYIASGKWAEDYNKIKNLKFKIKNSSIPDGIDVNMGCPNRDIIHQGAGAALIKEPQMAEKIIKAIKKKIKIPLSVKTRIGWKNNKNILTFCRMLESAGANAIVIHGRTVAQGFTGSVDWQTIYEVKKQLTIPVIGNGGIDENLKFKIKNLKLDGYMIGRGALGNPWIFKNLKSQTLNLKSDSVTIAERKKIILRQAKLAEKLKGKQGIRELRKHLPIYFRGVPYTKKIRAKLVQVAKFKDIQDILSKWVICP